MAKSFGDKLANQLEEHAGWAHLEEFGDLLVERPLNHEALRIFLASTACFFREIPGGILSLALRVTDDRISQDRFGAIGDASRILLAAVDEYGLSGDGSANTRNHHELFRDLAVDLGVTLEELENPDYIIPQAEILADITRKYYREGHVASSVGFHFASEVTSDREFEICYNAFSKYSSHYFTDALDEKAAREKFSFYYIHTLVEPEHASSSADAIRLYTRQAENIDLVLQGAYQFMDAYGIFWKELSTAIKTT